MKYHSDGDFFEEEEKKVAEDVGVDVVLGEASPQPINNPLEVQVRPAAESPESSSLSVSPGTPSSVALSPPPVPPVGDALSFMGFYTENDIVNLEQWAVDASGLRGTPDFRIEERRFPLI